MNMLRVFLALPFAVLSTLLEVLAEKISVSRTIFDCSIYYVPGFGYRGSTRNLRWCETPEQAEASIRFELNQAVQKEREWIDQKQEANA